MEQSQLATLGETFKGRREQNRQARERGERANSIKVLLLGLLGGLVVAAALFFGLR